jgi:cytochrome c553
VRLLLVFALAVAGACGDDFFETKVRPTLAGKCFACHSADNRMSGLELTSREAMLKGGASGPAIRSGDPDGSLLIQAIRHTHERLKMPPGGKLSDAEIEALATWVRNGTAWPSHPVAPKAAVTRITPEQRSWWSFQPVRKPAPPAVKDAKWAATPIDRFVLARLEAGNLKPVEPADRRTMIRRASYDLTGLPPTPAEVDAFMNDKSPQAFAAVIDKLLASPRYGERWGRYWLDTARYSDDKLNSTQDEPQPNVWRYRDWVIQALNDDMPYNRFVKAQIAGDMMEPRERYLAGLGFFANSPQFQDDRVDALTRGFLALTVACAQCHDHKFDPIPQRDYYSLLGIFENSKPSQHPLVSEEIVKAYERRKTAAEEGAKAVRDFENAQAEQLAEILAAQTARYVDAVRAGARDESLDQETLERWTAYLNGEQQHPFLKGWREASFDTAAFQRRLLDIIGEKKEIDRENLIRLGGKDDGRTVRVIEVRSLERDKYMLWREVVAPDRRGKVESGVLYYKAGKIDRFLAPQWNQHAGALRAEAERLKKEVPEQYPFLMTLKDVEQPKNMRIHIRGDRNNPGAEAPRQFLTVLCNGDPEPFTEGSGRLQLAEAIADESNPLTPRVIANRVWMHHFGRPLVGTPGNFGRLGEQPTHPELLDYLAARLVEQKWSLKALHREIMLSNVYALSARVSQANHVIDSDNKLLWRANRRRLDVEPMRDTLLFVTGDLDEARGGEAQTLTDLDNRRRTVYGFVSRRRLDGTLSLFDFPNPVATSDARVQTATPLQQLFFMNSEFIRKRAESLVKRLQDTGPDDRARVREAYRILLQRAAADAEIKAGLEYLAAGGTWPRYAQALLSSNELLFVD